MTSFHNDDGNNPNTIIPKFESATQISERDQMLLRIGLVKDADTRRDFELRFVGAQDEERLQHERFKLARDAFVDYQIKNSLDLQLMPGGDHRSFEQRVTDLQKKFPHTIEAQGLAEDIEEQVKSKWDRIDSALDVELDRQTKDQSKDVPNKRLDNVPELTPTFRKAIGR